MAYCLPPFFSTSGLDKYESYIKLIILPKTAVSFLPFYPKSSCNFTPDTETEDHVPQILVLLCSGQNAPKYLSVTSFSRAVSEGAQDQEDPGGIYFVLWIRDKIQYNPAFSNPPGEYELGSS